MIRAYVNYASFGASIHVSLVQANEHDASAPRHVLRFSQVGDGDAAWVMHRWEPVDPTEPTEPTLKLDHEVANALMRGLADFYGGVDDQRMLRKDYNDERARVDKLTDAVIEIARASGAR